MEGETSANAASSVLVRAFPSIRLSRIRIRAGSPIARAILERTASSEWGAVLVGLLARGNEHLHLKDTKDSRIHASMENEAWKSLPEEDHNKCVEGEWMKNLMIVLADCPGSLAAMAETLGDAGISIEGGGMFVVDGKGVGNFLVDDGPAAQRTLEAAGIEVVRQDVVVIQKLAQDETGQLGKLLRRMAQADVNVLTQYSDHNHQLVLVVDDLQAANAVSDAWMQERSAREKAGSSPSMAKTRSHHYAVDVQWSGNKGTGTSSYSAYDRSYDISASRKGVISGSSDPAFRGDGTRYNPEELLVASASACHMLTYLHLCAVNGIVVMSYADHPTGEMDELTGTFVRVDLHPSVTITAESDARRAKVLHETAHESCFIANSLKVSVMTHPKIMATRL